MVSLSGVEVNKVAFEKAKQNLPDADLHLADAGHLPFPDENFDCVTCIEVLEHIPAASRRQSLHEMRRVLRRGGRLVLRVPHAGTFAFLDSNNLRFRAPRLYDLLLRKGRRDEGYARSPEGVVWHHHFNDDELLKLLGEGWEIEASRRGGLFLMPLADIACWPFYRLQRLNGRLYRMLQRVMNFDIGCDYGPASFDLLLVLKRLS
jgi:SAM-dependent methyltransferase